MGRRAEGWRIRRVPEPNGPFQVRFTHDGRRYEFALGTCDPGAATEAAARRYSDVVSGRHATQAKVERSVHDDTPALHLFALWIDAMKNTRAAGTVRTWKVYARTFARTFVVASDFTAAKVDAFVSERLGAALRKTIAKELSALRTFLEWAVKAGHLVDAPAVPKLPRSAAGTRTGTRKERHTAFPRETLERLLAAMPAWSRAKPARDGKPERRFAVAAYFSVLWETGLRGGTIDRLEAPRHYRVGAAQLFVSDDIDKNKFGRKLDLTDGARAALDSVAPMKGAIFGKHDRRRYLDDAAKEIGMGDEDRASFCAYDIRHSRATQLLEATGNLPGVAFIVGHTQVTTTNKYAHGSARAARDVFAATGGFGGSGSVSGIASISSAQSETATPEDGGFIGVSVDLRRIELPTSRVRWKGKPQNPPRTGEVGAQNGAALRGVGRRSGIDSGSERGNTLPRLAKAAAVSAVTWSALDAFSYVHDDGSAEAVRTR